MAGFYGVNLLKKEENRRTSKKLPSKQGTTGNGLRAYSVM